MSFEPIRRILPKAIQSAGISTQVTSARVLEQAKELILTLWGPEKAKYVEPISFHEGIIKWKVYAPIALQEIKIWEARLINELNRSLNKRAVLRFAYTS